jgi:hypothetical protein
MRQKLIIGITSMFLCMSVHAQSLWDTSKPDRNFTFGVRAGVNFAKTDMDYATSSRTGFHAGGVVDWNIIKSFSVTSGLSYVDKGFWSDFGKGRAGYLQVPVLASYRIETPKGVWFHFNIGPYFAWGVSGKVNYRPYDESFTYSFQQNSFGKKGFFQHFDMGMVAGGYILIGKIVAGLSYEYGFVDIAKVYGKFHNRNVCFTVGYNF